MSGSLFCVSYVVSSSCLDMLLMCSVLDTFYTDFFFLMIRRPPRSTQSRSSAASDVYKRQASDVYKRQACKRKVCWWCAARRP